MIVTQCQCGNSFLVADRMAGALRPCPACGKSVLVPGGEAERLAEELARQPAVQFDQPANNRVATAVVLFMGGLAILVILAVGYMMRQRMHSANPPGDPAAERQPADDLADHESPPGQPEHASPRVTPPAQDDDRAPGGRPGDRNGPTATDPSPAIDEPPPPAIPQAATARWLGKVEQAVFASRFDLRAKQDGDEYIFIIPRYVGPKSGYGFLDVPEKLQGKVVYEFVDAERAVRVKVTDISGISMVEILTARYDHERNVIALKPTPQAGEQYSRQLNSLTIEAYIKDDNGNASIIRCSLAGPPKQATLSWNLPDWNHGIHGLLRDVPDHPMNNACSILMSGKIEGTNAYIGAALGPAARDHDDPAYTAFVGRQRAILAEGLTKAKISVGKQELEQELGGVKYDRTVIFMTRRRDTITMLSIVMRVQDGYCVAHWYLGPARGWDTFVSLLPQAKVTVE